jgi:hypothetical protein
MMANDTPTTLSAEQIGKVRRQLAVLKRWEGMTKLGAGGISQLRRELRDEIAPLQALLDVRNLSHTE